MSYSPTILSQMLQFFPRHKFEKLVNEHRAEYHARGVKSWSQFAAMLYAQLSGYDSLRCIEAGLATQGSCLYHIGVTPLNRSSLAYANEHRPAALYEALFQYMLSECQSIAPKHKFRFKNPIYSMDATTIKLCLSLFDWAKFRKAKGAVKLHVKFNHAGYLPTFAIVTTGKVHERTVAPQFSFESGDVAVFDRGYLDYEYFKSLDNKGVIFVTRLKSNSVFKVIERRKKTNPNILADQIIELKGFYSHKDYPTKLRRIVARDPETKKKIVILTNNFSWAASTIGKIYKDRWQIELFFKTMKQQLQIKSFVGTSFNALLSQLWTALIAYLLLSYLKFKSKFQWSLYTLSSIIPGNIFSRRNLWDWLNNPYRKHGNGAPASVQLKLSFG